MELKISSKTIDRLCSILRRGGVNLVFEDEYKSRGIKGEVFFDMRDAATGCMLDRNGVPTLAAHTLHIPNLIVRDASILIARLLKDPEEPRHGIFALALGTGDVAWDPLNPPAPTVDQRALFNELARKTFSATDFIWDNDPSSPAPGAVAGVPTHIIDLTTVFGIGEAVGPLCEMGLVGGNCADSMAQKHPVPAGAYDVTVDLSATEIDTIINFITIPVISKPATSNLTITWRLTT
jgi:hypothetical protein